MKGLSNSDSESLQAKIDPTVGFLSSIHEQIFWHQDK